jgi:DNA-binding transcriptional regulator YiaG
MKKNPCRTIMQEYAEIEGICTQCFSARSIEGRCQCVKCLGRCRSKRHIDIKRYQGYVNNYHKRKATSLAGAIKIFRKNSGMSQRQLSDLLKVTRISIINWEKGKHKPNRTCRHKLMKLGLEIPREEAPKKDIMEKKIPKKKITADAQYFKEWRKKRLYKKVRNLDLIKHAVQDGKIL